jgi:DNA-binding transcriptional LysR family regulator
MPPRRDRENWDARIGRRLRLRDLHVLLSVVQWGSMAKAAQHLAVTQPAVSKSIADLEQALRVRLLDRGPQGVEPTPCGLTLVRHALAVFDELRQGVAEVEFIANSTIGEVRVGCHESLVAAFLPEVIERLSERQPGVTVHVEQLSHPISVEARRLRQRELDLILARGLFDVPEDDVQAEVLFKESFIVVAGVTSRWARRRRLELAELMEEKWILYPPEQIPGVLVRAAFRARGLSVPRARIYTMSYHVRDALLTSGTYLTVIADCMLGVLNAKRRTAVRLPVELGIEPRSVAIFSLKNRSVSPAARLLMECARAVAKARYSSPSRQSSPQPGR